MNPMKYKTLFLEASDAQALTEQVNDLEEEGWEFVSVQLACLQLQFDPDRGLGRDTRPREKPQLLSKMLATLRRKVQPSECEKNQPARPQVDVEGPVCAPESALSTHRPTQDDDDDDDSDDVFAALRRDR